MELHGIHHITAITGDAPANVEFYVGVLGLRMVKKTVNQDDPTVYHLFYADEAGSPGADLTFFEYPGVGRGSPGAGMVHRIVWRVGSRRGAGLLGGAALGAGLDPCARTPRCGSRTPRDSSTSWSSTTARRAAGGRRARRPAEHALQGFDGVRAYTFDPARSPAAAARRARLPRRRATAAGRCAARARRPYA